MILLLIAAQGQVAKFDNRPPIAEYESSRTIGEIERCLIRSAAPPIVYRQPDRPADVSIVWPGVSLSAGNAAGRVDLQSLGEGRTMVRNWLSKPVVERCAPATPR